MQAIKDRQNYVKNRNYDVIYCSCLVPVQLGFAALIQSEGTLLYVCIEYNISSWRNGVRFHWHCATIRAYPWRQRYKSGTYLTTVLHWLSFLSNHFTCVPVLMLGESVSYKSIYMYKTDCCWDLLSAPPVCVVSVLACRLTIHCDTRMPPAVGEMKAYGN